MWPVATQLHDVGRLFLSFREALLSGPVLEGCWGSVTENVRFVLAVVVLTQGWAEGGQTRPPLPCEGRCGGACHGLLDKAVVCGVVA